MDYKVGDVVSREGAEYKCIRAEVVPGTWIKNNDPRAKDEPCMVTAVKLGYALYHTGKRYQRIRLDRIHEAGFAKTHGWSVVE